jgi:hypothetical protein
MKAYKIDLSGFTGKVREVVSEAVQKKAFDLGYKWFPSRGFVNTDKPWLAFSANGKIGWNLVGGNSLQDYPLITVDAFLALTTAKDEPSFKPFDKVLVRDNDSEEWECTFYSNESGTDVTEYPHNTVSGHYRHCIPYEGNESLLGTTDSPE